MSTCISRQHVNRANLDIFNIKSEIIGHKRIGFKNFLFIKNNYQTRRSSHNRLYLNEATNMGAASQRKHIAAHTPYPFRGGLKMMQKHTPAKKNVCAQNILPNNLQYISRWLTPRNSRNLTSTSTTGWTDQTWLGEGETAKTCSLSAYDTNIKIRN